jgi:hypothetical protein
MYFEVLALVITQLGFINRELGDFLSAIFPGHGIDHGADQLVDLFLAVIGDLLLSLA